MHRLLQDCEPSASTVRCHIRCRQAARVCTQMQPHQPSQSSRNKLEITAGRSGINRRNCRLHQYVSQSLHLIKTKPTTNVHLRNPGTIHNPDVILMQSVNKTAGEYRTRPRIALGSANASATGNGATNSNSIFTALIKSRPRPPHQRDRRSSSQSWHNLPSRSNPGAISEHDRRGI